MRSRTIFGWGLSALVSVLGIWGPLLACAESDVTADPPPGEDAASRDAGTLNDAVASDAVRALPVCSASKICVSAAPIDRRVNLTSVWGSSEADVWAVGSAGSILHFGGAAWEKADLAAEGAWSPFTLRSVWLERPDDVWIVDGHSVRHASGWKGPRGTEWSYFGERVGSKEEPIPTAIRGAGHRVWLTRQLDPRGFGGTLAKFGPWEQGGPKAPVEVGSPRGTSLTALAVARPDEVWAIGESKVLRVSLPSQDETEWQVEEYDSHTTKALLGVWGDSEGVWLVGEGGVIRHLASNAAATKKFDVVPSPVTFDLYGVFGFGPNDVWAVGEASTVLHWDGVRWSTLSTPFDDADDKPRLFGVWGSSPADVWIVGGGAVLRFQENGR